MINNIKFPTHISITANALIPMEVSLWDKERFVRENYSQEDIENELEQKVRDQIWEYLTDNKIQIKFI